MIETIGEVEMALERFLDKLEKWLVTQEEWPLVFLGSRGDRKEAARLLAKSILLIPPRQFAEFEPNRAMRREMIRTLMRQVRSTRDLA